MRWLLRLYPAAWRRRYEAEFLALLEARGLSLRDGLDIVRGALDARIRPQVPSLQVETVGPSVAGEGRFPMNRYVHVMNRFAMEGPPAVIACWAMLALLPALDRLVFGEESVVGFAVTLVALLLLLRMLSQPRFGPRGPILGAAIAAVVVLVSAVSLV